jgi:hypothetical protein
MYSLLKCSGPRVYYLKLQGHFRKSTSTEGVSPNWIRLIQIWWSGLDQITLQTSMRL